jgi:hypothetical protein
MKTEKDAVKKQVTIFELLDDGKEWFDKSRAGDDETFDGCHYIVGLKHKQLKGLKSDLKAIIIPL